LEGCLDRPPDPLPTRVDSLPDLPDAYERALEAGLAAIGVQLSSDARATIDGHVRLLLAWNAAINLTAIRDPAEIAIRHVVDSLTALRVLEARGVKWILDLGSGGGFPGLPLLAALPWGRGVLVESVGKKARFLQTVVEATGMQDVVTVQAVRAEELVATGGAPRGAVVVARAVASLGELIELALPLVGPGSSLIAWKDVRAVSEGAELEGARRAIAAIDPGARMNAVPAVPDDAGPAVDALRDHRLVIITRSGAEIARTWPRDPAARKRRPW
jgi:16S rRNA (guanine527-N7)-methyltransferase